jgi:hypothetical protein
LREEHAFALSYGAVYRFVRRLEPRTPEAFVRLEVPLARFDSIEREMLLPLSCRASGCCLHGRSIVSARLER